MKKTGRIMFTVILSAFFFMNFSPPSFSQEHAPIIQVAHTVHVFPAVFEGEELSHTFTVFNKGTTDLLIKKVTHS